MSEASFTYRLKISPRGKRVRLRVTLQHGLEVVIPKGYDEKKVPALLERKKHWIRTAMERAESNRKFFEPEPKWQLPLQIKLPAVGAIWYVTAKESKAGFVAVRELGADQLLVFGAIRDAAACRAALARWLMRQTREHLVPRLEGMSRETGLHYTRVFVKRQRTRWASCSRHGTLSLNAKLLFLPPELVHYVMAHELCHLIEMNHGKGFWALLAQHCPEYRRLDTRLRDVWKCVPRWASVNSLGRRLTYEGKQTR
jgi:predicted metal-dependent hydrolase